MKRQAIAAGCAAGLLMAALWHHLPAVAAGVSADSVDSHVPKAAATNNASAYASPLELALSPDQKRLYVVCQQAGQVRELDAVSGRTLRAVAVGREPRGFTFSPHADRLFVVNSWDDTVSVIDIRSFKVIANWPVAAEPSSVMFDTGNNGAGRLFVANRISNDVAVLNASTGAEEARLTAGRGASYMAASSNSGKLFVTHIYPNPGPHRTAPESEVTIIDPSEARVVDRMQLHSIAGVFHIALSNDGRLGVIAHLHPKNLVPLAHVEHGWAFGNTITVFGADVGGVIEVPLDELDRYFALPFGVAIAPDKSRIYITHGGSDCVSIIDVPGLLRFIHAHPTPFAQDLSASAHYVVARIAVGRNPRGVALTRDGHRLYVANRLDDTISVIDTRTNRVVSTFVLEGPKTISALRRGEQAFYSAQFAFQGQFGCSSCHIDSTFDGLTWDLEPDGFGVDIVDNRLLEDLSGTEPFKWNGGNPSIPIECGVRTEKYFWRSENYDNRTLGNLTQYVLSLPQRPNRWRLANSDLTPAQERGKAIFERSEDRFGKPIPLTNRCSYCHSGSKGTNQKSFDVGTGRPTDRSGRLDTPQLMNIALTAPYLHDGSARSLEEIWTVYNPHDQHGRTNDLTKDQLNDLIEYLRTR
ncbi:MAG TPA: hypothetical protein VHD85_17590 [Terracidiphilus sp.]|nr:hypothetical protein [Terracidiphilus sp.]